MISQNRTKNYHKTAHVAHVIYEWWYGLFKKKKKKSSLM